MGKLAEVYPPSANWLCLLTTAAMPLSKLILRRVLTTTPLMFGLDNDNYNPIIHSNFLIDLAGNLDLF